MMSGKMYILVLMCALHYFQGTVFGVPADPAHCSRLSSVIAATSPRAQVSVAISVVRGNFPTQTTANVTTLNPSSSLRAMYSALSREFNRTETENGYNTFISAINEISIAQNEACRNRATATTSSATRLIREFQVAFGQREKDLSQLRSILGKLLCINSTSKGIRIKRQTGCSSAHACACPSGGISSQLICPCQFFNCLDPNDVLKPLLGFIPELSDSQCLAFVIDTTGSMATEINTAKAIVREFLAREGEIGDWGCYILIPFNDFGPDSAIVPERSVGPITFADTAQVGDLQTLRRAVESLTDDGGGDIPEYALYAMLQGFREINPVLNKHALQAGSQMIVITDASSKQPELENNVITTAQARRVCIHFFTAEHDKIYDNIARSTFGTTVQPFSSWRLANFAAAYRSNPCVYTTENGKRRKRSTPTGLGTEVASYPGPLFSRGGHRRRPAEKAGLGTRLGTEVPANRQNFNVTRFAVLLRLSINARRGSIVTLTRPNRTEILIRTRTDDDFGIFSEKNPIPGNWQARVNTGNLRVTVSQTLLMDITVVYGTQSTIVPPACTSGHIALVTSQARNIQQANLKLVDQFGDVQQSVPLSRCNRALITKRQVNFPLGSFTYHLMGRDSHGIQFDHDTRIRVEFRNHISSFRLHNTGPQTVHFVSGSTATLSYTLANSNDFSSRFTFTASVATGFVTRVIPATAEVRARGLITITVTVRVARSSVTAGTSSVVTLTASNSCINSLVATRSIAVRSATLPPPPDCDCLNGGTCFSLLRRGRTLRLCRCRSGFSGSRCQFSS